MSAGRVLAAIGSVVLGLAAAALLIGGAGIVLFDAWQRGGDGYLTSTSLDVSTAGNAIVTEGVDFIAGPGDWVPDDAMRVQLDVRSSTETPVFIGIARTADLRAYLEDVDFSVISEVVGDNVTYRHAAGATTPAPPAEQDFWVASAAGVNPEAISWELTNGSWSAVMMNADGSADVSATATAGVAFGVLRPIAWALVIAGVVALIPAAILFVVAIRRPPAPYQPVPPQRELVKA